MWERESEKGRGGGERSSDEGKQRKQAGRQLQRVCQAAKSVANYAIQRGTSSPPPPIQFPAPSPACS